MKSTTKTNDQFRQKHRVGVAGNLINQIMANNSTLPEVGKGATQLHYSDRTCYEVVEVSVDYKTVKLEELDAKADPTKKLDVGHQEWILEPTGKFKTVVWRHNAWYSKFEVVKFTKEFIAKAQKENNDMALYKSLTPEQYKAVYGNDMRPQNVVPGITEKRFEYNKLNLIFGRKDYYYDWSF